MNTKFIFFLIIPLVLFGLVQSADAIQWRDTAEQHLARYYGSTGTACGTTTYLKDEGGFQLLKSDTTTTGECSNVSMTFDTSSMPVGITVTDTDVAFTVDSVLLPTNCDITPVTVNPATATAQALWNDILDGTEYVNNDSSCTTTGAKSIDLGATADSDVQSRAANNLDFSIGLKYDSMVRDGTSHQIVINTATPVLTIVYTMNVPDPPTLPSASQTTITWGTPEGNGASPDDVKIEYSDEGASWATVATIPVATGTWLYSSGNPAQFSDSDPQFRLSANNTSGFSEVQQVFNSTISTNLKSYWPLKSTLNDNGIENNDGTITGTEIYDSVGQYFDGSSYDTIGNETDYDYDRTDSFSSCFSAKWTSAANMSFISKRDATAPNSGWELVQTATLRLAFQIVNTVTVNALVMTSPSTYNDGIEHRICWTYAGTSLPSGVKLYVDNSEQSLTTTVNNLSSSILNNKSLYLGTRDAGTIKYTGSMGDVMIVSQVMDAHQVAEDYQNYIDHLVRPQNVVDLTIPSVSLTSVGLDWTTPQVYEETLLGYQINYTTPYGGPSTIVTNNTGTNTTDYDVTGLNAGTPYSFRVQAWSSGGKSYGSGNIENATTQGDNFVIGNLTVPSTVNPSVLPFVWTKTEVNATTTLLEVTYPSTFDTAVAINSKFANTDVTYSNLNTTSVGGGLVKASFYFTGATGDLITAVATDQNTNATSSYVIAWSQFPLLDQLQNFTNGTYGTEGKFGVLDLISMCVIILSMIGFNRVNAGVGAIFSVIIVGALAYFQIIAWQTTITAGIAAMVLFAITTHHKEGSS